MPGKQDANFGQLRQIGILTTIPVVLAAGPVIGFFAGGWLDRKFHIFPWLTIILIGLGFIASGMEVARMIREATETGSSKDKTPKA